MPTNIQHYPSDETRKLQPNRKSKTPKFIYVSLTSKKHCKKLPRFQKTFPRKSVLLKSPPPHWAKPLCVSNAIFSLLIHSPAARKERYTIQTQPQICHHVEDTILSIFSGPRVCIWYSGNLPWILKLCGIKTCLPRQIIVRMGKPFWCNICVCVCVCLFWPP